MFRRITLLLFIGLAWGQLIDELETLGKYNERFLFQPENYIKVKESGIATIAMNLLQEG